MRLFLLAAVPALAGAAWGADVLQAGVAKVEITPTTGLPMYGYEARGLKPAEGKHDPLFAKTLVLACGKDRVAIVTLDAGAFHSDALRKRAADELGIPLVLFNSSHTHSGPVFLRTLEDNPPISPAQEEYRREVDRKIFGALKEAVGSLSPARLGLGRGSLQLGYNRLVLGEDGRAHAEFMNYGHVAYGPVDPEFVILRVEDASGAVRAILVHYACHSVVLQSTNFLYSADYPGVLQAKVEAAFKGAQCMFVQGGAGDINPMDMGTFGRNDEDFKEVEKMGSLLAEQVLRTTAAIKASIPEHPDIRYKTEVLSFPNRWDKSKTMRTGIATVLIDGEIAIATVPGEPMHSFQAYWKAHADVPWPLFYGYTMGGEGDWPGYIPDLRSAAYGGYGSADDNTIIDPGAGEEMMLHHVKNLYQLRGMWHDKPEAN
jgi:neutral ceramidase